ncbi:16874_t:CDS:2, partial [Dentiscutata heterogama]
MAIYWDNLTRSSYLYCSWVSPSTISDLYKGVSRARTPDIESVLSKNETPDDQSDENRVKLKNLNNFFNPALILSYSWWLPWQTPPLILNFLNVVHLQRQKTLQ